MTIYTLILYVAIAAAILTAITGLVFKDKVKSWSVSDEGRKMRHAVP